ncbi:glycoside hydrolase family 16 protein [Sporormia fimetaria CBS 119925]|uniref:Glycoside hydrolase family 16 protein n=1 Tax=Sporormia fimetaria CBS 119925 TaxID=1340428 RepID=A0A6A6VHA4_9PLEO|nr:glycoside hydrolase family 16 protein [Sporormia fimetaria CBS 119925]
MASGTSSSKHSASTTAGRPKADRQPSPSPGSSTPRSITHSLATGPSTPVLRSTPSRIAIRSELGSSNGLASSNGFTSSTGLASSTAQTSYFKSRRIKKSEIQRPWLDQKDPREKWTWIIPLVGILLGLGIATALVWMALRSVVNHKYCLVLNDNFTTWDSNVWSKEVQVDGFGNGQFEMTTNTEENVYVVNNTLVIKPTVQDPTLLENNFVIDLRGNGCTGTEWYQCVATTNVTNGTIINPVKSGRINTRLGASIKFGRVEVEAKLPAGDWLWPAIWMLPTYSVYGEWPRSGEMDIMHSRGNNYTYRQGGNNIVSSKLHFGPNKENDGWWRNNVKQHAPGHKTWASGWHTFGIEWSEKYIYTYIDTRLLQVMYTHFSQPFWEYGNFPLADANGTRLVNPWEGTGSKATPFDQDFYLVINVAVGGTNGWFEDGKSNKPWVDRSPTARRDFWLAKDQWEPTWRDQGFLQIRRVRMWQQEGHNGC